MQHLTARVRFPQPIFDQSIAFFNWYINEIHAHEPPFSHVLHAENGEYEYDWRPRQGLSRLTLAHIETGLVAMNAFDFTRIGDTDPTTMPPPPSLLLATWLDLCAAVGWIDEGERAVLADQLNPTIADDTHRFGEPVFS
jgi:hypothetical protein